MRAILYTLMAVGFLMTAGWTSAQEQTVGLLVNQDEAYEGYTLLAPLFHNTTYLINNDGEVVHAWTHALRPAGTTYLLPDGNLFRGSLTINPALNFGGLGGTIQEVDWEGNVVWEFVYSDSLHALHHDTARLPNGNILMVAWEYHSAEDAIAAGRNPDMLARGALWAEQIIEVRPTPPVGGEIVWEWHLWDHLIQDFDSTKANFGVVEDHPELVDLNYGEAPNADWIHANALNYNAELDQIVLSAPGFFELWIIDHSTMTEEAAGHSGGRSGKGGDFLYRWGNRQAYRAAPEDGQTYFRLQFNHDTQWIEPGLPGAGNMMVFDNGHNRRASMVHEVTLPLDDTGAYRRDADGAFSPPTPVWSYEQPGTFFSLIASGEQRMPNGNTLIAETDTGRIFEVTTEGEIVWQYISPVTDTGPLARNDSIPLFNVERGIQANAVFRAYRYAVDYSAFQGKDLTPMGPLEGAATAIDGTPDLPELFVLSQNFPNPFNPTTSIPFTIRRASAVTLSVYNMLGQHVATLADRHYERGTYVVPFDATGLPSGVYYYRLETDRFISPKAMILAK